MSSIQQNITQIISQIRKSEEKSARPHGSVQLLAVSKTKPIDSIVAAIDAGQYAFGENYVQEGVDKVLHFNQHFANTDLTWHFIGPIQSNKTRQIAQHFDWVHSIERSKIAQRLNDQRPTHLAPLQVLIQVNTSGEASKAGVSAEQTVELANIIATLPNLQLRGLMSIPANVHDYDTQYAAFMSLAQLQQRLQSAHPHLDTLSMGMSGDMDAAIAAGSTMVRIGTAIFGQRG